MRSPGVGACQNGPRFDSWQTFSHIRLQNLDTSRQYHLCLDSIKLRTSAVRCRVLSSAPYPADNNATAQSCRRYAYQPIIRCSLFASSRVPYQWSVEVWILPAAATSPRADVNRHQSASLDWTEISLGQESRGRDSRSCALKLVFEGYVLYPEPWSRVGTVQQ